ncbi:hypothetical protein PPL_08266 [Heterostelium album PN500]|uniref:Uncharacterized protein n=1 Tax=Heterostelium pallidum (strain ATCC 26659 / Pp 5 / PN500) TaxID=670386 RepID=D3BHQ3_HETP5|nr:hypothetical protein PPL_08266 [Heterostelium album PN500]EFA78803.1 hypothetical protein PPL_08266 [Heterostelium album PN500]|eukprot:XP_020430927.1 hypothetical protein PPL_08266 [Heterostelium album PN500]
MVNLQEPKMKIQIYNCNLRVKELLDLIRYAAINAGDSENENDESDVAVSIEALEASNIRTYEKALRAQQRENYLEAQQFYHDVLNSPLLSNTSEQQSSTSTTMSVLKYSTLKNLATISELVDDRERALNFFTRAIDIDASDLLVWYHIGRLAGELQRWNVSRLAFERALQLSPTHWMSLERLAELLYIIGDNQAATVIVKQARQIDSSHSRILLLEQLLSFEKEQQQQQTNNNNNNNSSIRNAIVNNEMAMGYLRKLVAKREKTIQNNSKDKDTANSSSEKVKVIADSSNNNEEIKDSNSNEDQKTKQFQLYKPLEILIDSKTTTTTTTANATATNVQQQQQQSEQLLTGSNDVIMSVEQQVDKEKEKENEPEKEEKDSVKEKDKESEKEKDKDITMTDSSNSIVNNPTSTIVIVDSSPAPSNSNSLNSSSSGIVTAAAAASVGSTTTQLVAKRRATRGAVGNKYDDKSQEVVDFGEKTLKTTKLLSPNVMNSLNFMNVDSSLTSEDAVGVDGSQQQKSPKQQQQQLQHQLLQERLLHQQSAQVDVETSQSFEKNMVYQFISNVNHSDFKYTIIDWFISYLNKITMSHQQIDQTLIAKLINMSNIINKYNSNFQKYILFFAELSFDYLFSKLEQSNDNNNNNNNSNNSNNNNIIQQQITKRQKKEDGYYSSYSNDIAIQSLDLSYMMQLLNSNREQFNEDTYYCIRYYWLLARYTKYLGDINLASVYFGNCDERFQQWIQHNPSALIILQHCKHDRYISKSALSERIETLQDQQEKNRASQLYATGEFTKVISILDPLFPDAFCLFDPTASTPATTTTTDFKSREIIDTNTRSKLNMIEYLLQSYLNTSNIKGVFKMSIFLMKELTLNYNDNIANSTLETLNQVFSHLNMKPEPLEEPLTTLSSILTKQLYRHFKKNMLYDWLNLFIKVYQFDLNTELTLSNKLALLSGYHAELAKKKQCRSNDRFLLDYLELSFKFIINPDIEINPADFNEIRPELAILKIFTDLSQCFYCLYSIKLTNNVEDHQCQSLAMELDSPNLYVQIYYMLKIIAGEEEEINLPLNGQVNQAISLLQSIATKKEFKDLVERLYNKFPEPPERVTRYRATINQYFDGESDEIVEFPESVSPPRVNFEIQLFNNDKQLSLQDPLFDDIYTDIYYMYASTLPNDKHLHLKEELLKKDLYSNPNRILSWTLLSKSFQSEVTTITAEKGCLSHNTPAIQQEIWKLYAKLRLIYKHLALLTPKEEIYRYLGLLLYEQHYFASPEFASDPTNLNSLFKEALKYFEQSEKLATNDLWYYPLYYGKISFKVGDAPEVYFDYLWNAVQLLPPLTKKNPPIDPLYRLHTSRLKLLLPYSSSSLNDTLLTLLEKYNFTPPTTATTTTPATSTTTNTTNNINNNNSEDKENNGTDVNMLDLSQDSNLETEGVVVVTPPLSLEARRENLIDNSLAALNCCKSLVSYHHQSSYRVAWTIRYQTTKEDYMANSLKEFIRLMKPKLSRLSRAAVWNLWNEGYLGDGKLDRYFKKYYRFFIQLLEENGDYTNLDVVHAKLKQEDKFKNEAILCYSACCRVLQIQFIDQQKHKQQQQQQQQKPISSQQQQQTQQPINLVVSPPTSPSSPTSATSSTQTQSTTTTTTTSTEGNNPTVGSPSSTQQQSTTTLSSTISPEEAKLNKLLQSLWEMYTDITLYPDHKDQLYDLMRKSYQLVAPHSLSPQDNISDEKIVEFYEKKFSLKDKRKKK